MKFRIVKQGDRYFVQHKFWVFWIDIEYGLSHAPTVFLTKVAAQEYINDYHKSEVREIIYEE